MEGVKISNSTLAGMIITACLSFLIPIITFIIIKKKTKASASNVVVGALTFVFFALMLEPILHNIVLNKFGDTFNNNIYLYGLYGGLAAATFEEVGRFLAMKFLINKNLSKENSLMYGIGHGGIEAILLGGVTYISNMAVCLMINNGTFQSSLNALDEISKTEAINQLSALWTTPSSHFYLAGLERIMAFVLQICLSYLVYKAIKEKNYIYFGYAFLIHFLVDAIIVVLASKISLVIVEAILAIAVICIAFFTYKKYKEEV